MAEPKTIIQAKADKATRDLARSMGRPIDDPILRDFRKGVAMALGRRVYLNKLKAEERERQPGLFTGGTE